MAKLTKVTSANTTTTGNGSWGLGLVFFALAIVSIALIVVQFDTFETVAYPMQEFSKPMFVTSRKNAGSLSGLEKIGLVELIGVEDIAYDPKSGVVYMGCEDGWIKRVMLNYSGVENWVHTGGRPLGIAIDDFGDVFVADAFKGLLKVSVDGELELLTNEAEGVKFGLIDDIAIAKNGMVYFTDATYKYGLHQWFHDLLEGRPHGRLLSYDPSTKQTNVIVQDLYFANRYDGDGYYWLAIAWLIWFPP
ncbi:hypothetical protein L6452_40153 [Arctium lappa]|uniref:Uncharacterized protein n=1 Tax=Arctium lappa TaxID=4217 RepID=A0ACB8XL53_ARCLA|nr:hypothetical protein L6452_40153 [Arctium lappa]